MHTLYAYKDCMIANTRKLIDVNSLKISLESLVRKHTDGI